MVKVAERIATTAGLGDYGNRELGEIKRDNDKFIYYLESIGEVPSRRDGLNLLDRVNRLLSRTNSGAYGVFTEKYDRENKRLGDSYKEFWNRMDQKQKDADSKGFGGLTSSDMTDRNNDKIASELLKVARGLISSEGFVFLIHDVPKDEYQVAYSLHNHPKYDKSRLETNRTLSKSEATRIAEKFSKTQDYELLTFIQTGKYPRFKYKEVNPSLFRI